MYREITKSFMSKCELFDLGSCHSWNWQYSLDRLAVDINQLHTVNKGISKTLSWAKEFDNSKESSYIKGKRYFYILLMREANVYKRPDHFPYISDWYKSVVRLNMSAVMACNHSSSTN